MCVHVSSLCSLVDYYRFEASAGQFTSSVVCPGAGVQCEGCDGQISREMVEYCPVVDFQNVDRIVTQAEEGILALLPAKAGDAELFKLMKIDQNSKEEVSVARSYDGQLWSGFLPDPVPLYCDLIEQIEQCYAVLSGDTEWRLDRVLEASSSSTAQNPADGALEAKLLMQTTFGTTQEDLDKLVSENSNASRWIHQQMDTPATLHR